MTSFLEEVDLLRALHAHQVTVFNQVEANQVLSVPSHSVAEQAQEGKGV